MSQCRFLLFFSLHCFFQVATAPTPKSISQSSTSVAVKAHSLYFQKIIEKAQAANKPISQVFIEQDIKNGKGMWGFRKFIGGQNDCSFACLAHGTDIQKMQFALEHGEDINVQDAHGKTALMNVAKTGNIDCIQFLIAHGADFR